MLIIRAEERIGKQECDIGRGAGPMLDQSGARSFPPSLRLKNGFGQDDARGTKGRETQTAPASQVFIQHSAISNHRQSVISISNPQ
jgi:hypothetical protein